MTQDTNPKAAVLRLLHEVLTAELTDNANPFWRIRQAAEVADQQNRSILVFFARRQQRGARAQLHAAEA